MINCPYCGQSHYTEKYSMTTALGWTPEYKNGKIINNNPNTSTVYCTCCECKHDFHYTVQYETVQEIIDDGLPQEVPVIETPINMPSNNTLEMDEDFYLIKSREESNSIELPTYEQRFARIEEQIEELRKEVIKLVSLQT